MSKQDADRIMHAKALLAQGDRCLVCEQWAQLVPADGLAPAVGECNDDGCMSTANHVCDGFWPSFAINLAAGFSTMHRVTYGEAE